MHSTLSNENNLMKVAKRTIIAPAATVVLILALSGCGGSDPVGEAADGAVKQVVKDAADGAREHVDSATEKIVDDIAKQVGGEDFVIELNGVPADFPSEIPIADGDTFGTTAPGEKRGSNWHVTVTTPGTGLMNQEVAKFEAAGFVSAIDALSIEDMSKAGTYFLANDTYDVTLMHSEDAGSTRFVYLVSPKAG